MPRPEIEPKTALAKRLRGIRLAVGDPDRRAFSRALGISPNSLAYYERGDNDPTATVLSAYISVFHISADWLMTGRGVMFPEGDENYFPSAKTDINAAHLQKAVKTVERALMDRELPADKKAELIKIVYAQIKAGKETGFVSYLISLLRGG